MTLATTAGSAPLSRADAGRLLGHTMGLVALTAGLFARGAYIGRDLQADGQSAVSLFGRGGQ